jgi:hypothetical protein
MSFKHKKVGIIALAASLAACHPTDSRLANRENFGLALQTYLSSHGDMCIGKFTWPIDVSYRDAQARSANSLQMPVMQKMGLVSAQQIEGQGEPVMRYQLTDAGRKFYVHKPMQSLTPQGGLLTHDGDFCYGHLQLDQVIGWSRVQQVAGQSQTVVTYTYRIDAASWTRNADMRRVFPMVAMIVDSGGVLQLKQTVRLGDKGWAGVAATRY